MAIRRHLRQLDGVRSSSPPEEQATFDALTAEQTKLESEYEGADELPDEVDARLGEIEAALAAFENRPARYEPAEIARAGVFVSIDVSNLSCDYINIQESILFTLKDAEK